MNSQTDVNLLPLKNVLPELVEFGTKRAEKKEEMECLIEAIKAQQKSDCNVISEVRKELGKLEIEVAKISTASLFPFHQLHSIYDKVLGEMAVLIEVTKPSRKRKTWIKDTRAYNSLITRNLDKSETHDEKVVLEDQKEEPPVVSVIDKDGEKELEKQRKERTPRKQQMSYRLARDLRRQMRTKSRSVAKSDGLYRPQIGKTKRKTPVKQPIRVEVSPRKKFTCFCNETPRLTLSEYILHKIKFHAVQRREEKKKEQQSQDVGTPKFGKGNVTRNMSKSTEAKTPILTTVYEVKENRKLEKSNEKK